MTRYFKRPFASLQYTGLKQKQMDGCIFASIAGALNYLHGEELLTEEGLISAWKKSGHEMNGQNLANVLKVAQQSVDFDVKVDHRNDFNQHAPSKRVEFISRIRQCLGRGGVAIVSLRRQQHSMTRNGSTTSKHGHHMLTVVGESNADLIVWNTHGMFGVLTDDELTTDFLDVKTKHFDTSLAAKDQMEYLLLWID